MTTPTHPSAPAATGPSRPTLGPADVLGVPALPPAAVSGVGARVRAGVARLHRASGLPPQRVMEAALAPLDLAAAATLCHLDVPDRLTGPVDVTVLATELGLDPDRFARLARYAATRGLVRLDRRGRLRPTRVTAFLRRDHPGGWAAWVRFAAGGEVAAALSRLEDGLRPDGDAFAAANGVPFFDWMIAHPERHATFDGAMAAGGRMHGLLLARELDWAGTRTVCDVGGGDGTLLATLLAHHPELDGVLFELPAVVARAPEHDRIRTVGGDAFVEVPAGCDTYLLVNVVHDWSDDDAVRILEQVRAALPDPAQPGAGPRVVVLESEAHTRPRDDLSVRADLLMLALTPGGRERTTEEVGALARRAGLSLARTHRLASGDAAHVLVAAG
jgi:hypothetical protein